MGTHFSPMLNQHFSSKEQMIAFEKKAILDQQIKQNELIREQNRLLSNRNNNIPNISYNMSSDTSFTELLSIISVIPFVLGILALVALPGGWTAKLMGIRLTLGSCIFPSMNWVKSKRSVISVFMMTFIIIGFIFTLMIK